MVIKPSPRSVDETVSRMRDLLEAKGVKLFDVIDHSGEAQAAGLELADTKVVIFGNPTAGTPVMAAAPLAALDLPLKVLVWDDGGQTKLAYTAPAELAERYGLSNELAGRLAAIDAITEEVRDSGSEGVAERKRHTQRERGHPSRRRPGTERLSDPRELPALIDQRQLGQELGVGHGTVEAIFRHVPVVAIPGHRKVFVRRADVERFLSQHTYPDGDRVRPT